MYKAVIFDLDDTLYSYDDFVNQGFLAVAFKIQKDFSMNDRQRAAVLQKLENIYSHGDRQYIFNQVIKNFFPKMEARVIDAYVTRDLLYYYKFYPRQLRISWDADHLLKYLSRKKICIGLVTQGHPMDQYYKLSCLGIMDRFDAVEISGSYPRSKAKPSPFMFKKILQKLDVRSNEAIYVGNDLNADYGAVKAGMSLYWFTQQKTIEGENKKNVNIIHSLLEIKGVL